MIVPGTSTLNLNRALRVLANDLGAEALRELLQLFPVPEDRLAWVWLDGVDGFTLDFWPGPSGEIRWYRAGQLAQKRPLADVLDNVLSGRIFTSAGELRWRVLPVLGPKPVRTVFLGDEVFGQRFQQWLNPKDLPEMTARPFTYRLWGQQTVNTPGEWIELRIPHRFVYPVAVQSQVKGRVLAKLRAEAWVDGAGRVHFVRLCQVFAELEF